MAHAIDRTQVVDVYTSLLEAWNRRDAGAFAATFTLNGNAVGFDGSQMNGRSGIASELTRVFEHHPTATYVAIVREVRELAPGAMLLRAEVGMVPPGRNELNPATNAVQSVVVVHGPEGAGISLLQNTPAAFHGRPELSQKLTAELEAARRTGKVVNDRA